MRVAVCVMIGPLVPMSMIMAVPMMMIVLVGVSVAATMMSVVAAMSMLVVPMPMPMLMLCCLMRMNMLLIMRVMMSTTLCMVVVMIVSVMLMAVAAALALCREHGVVELVGSGEPGLIEQGQWAVGKAGCPACGFDEVGIDAFTQKCQPFIEVGVADAFSEQIGGVRGGLAGMLGMRMLFCRHGRISRMWF